MAAKPIKRNPNILSLSREHHFTLLFCWKLRQGIKKEVDGKRIIAYVDYFFNHFILTHFKEEEELLFCLVEDNMTEKAYAEHKQIYALATKIIAETNFSVADITQLADMVDNHTRYEERKLFPYLEERIPEDKLNEIGKTLNESAILKDNFEDEFWR